MKPAKNFDMEKFVTVGADFAITGDFEAQANQMLKMGTLNGATAVVAGEKPMEGASGGRIALLSDEGPELGGEAAAPLPLQYLLAGVAF